VFLEGNLNPVQDENPEVVQGLEALLAIARKDLGDDRTKSKGVNVRPLGN
jgi:hypothetical protein